MKLTSNDLLAFSHADMNTYDLSYLDIDKSIALKSIQEDLSSDIDGLNSIETMNARANFFNIKGAKVSDYQERLIVIDRERKLLCGIRHKGGDVNLPFIHIRATFELDGNDVESIYNDHLKSLFTIFSPREMNYWKRSSDDEGSISSVYLVGCYSDILKRDKWDNESSLTFQNVSDDSYYDWYASGYERFHSSNKNLKSRVTVNSKEEMNSSINDGLLKFILLNGSRIGLIAGERSEFLGNEGIYFNEIFINEEFKGKGMAKAVQRKFVESFAREKDIIWGTIDRLNIPSYKTAIGNGRRPIRFEVFKKISEGAL
jgi:predicted GNAT family acetyltransferase